MEINQTKSKVSKAEKESKALSSIQKELDGMLPSQIKKGNSELPEKVEQ